MNLLLQRLTRKIVIITVFTIVVLHAGQEKVQEELQASQTQVQTADTKREEHVQNSWDKVSALYLPSLISKEDKQKMLNQVNTWQSTANSLAQTKEDHHESIPEAQELKESEVLQKALIPVATDDHIKQILSYLASTRAYTTNQHDESIAIFDDTTYRDLNVFCGKEEAPAISLFNILNNTQTTPGQAALLDMLYNPLSDIKALTMRQEAIKKLVNDTQLFTSIQEKLSAINDAEHILFTLLSSDLFTNATDRFYLKSILDLPIISLATKMPVLDLLDLLNNFPWIKKINATVCDKFNDKPAMLEAIRLNNIILDTIVSPGFYLAGACFLGKQVYDAYKWNIGDSHTNSNYAANYLQKDNIIATCGAYSIIMLAVTPFIIRAGYKKVFDELDSDNILHNAVGVLARMTTALKDLQKIVTQHKELAAIIPFKDFQQEANVEFKKLLTLLDDKTFKQPATLTTLKDKLTTSKGKMIAAFKFLSTLKYDLVLPYIEVGKLDAFMSTATLYKKFEAYPNACFHFATYQQQATPHLALNESWNPFIKPDIVVTNALELGTTTAHRNMLITGPNAGGKSTTLKATAFAVLLAQTLTIANANITLTPFSKVFTTLNITDTIGKESLYQADKNRIKQVVTAIEELTPDKFALFISDEMFNSTAASYGAALYYGTLNYVDQSLKNTLFAAATHFENLIELEADTNGSVANFCVEAATKGANGKMQWTYKIIRGINKQNISFELAQEDGFNPRLLEAGKKLLQRHTPPVLLTTVSKKPN